MKTENERLTRISWIGPLNGQIEALRENGIDVVSLTCEDVDARHPELAKSQVVVVATHDAGFAKNIFEKLDRDDPYEGRLHAIVSSRDFLDQHIIGLQVTGRVNMWYVEGTSTRLIAAHIKAMTRDRKRQRGPDDMYRSLLNGY